MERATGTEVYGCGSPHNSDITLNIQTTTGGNFSISVNGKNTVEHLKKLVSKKLKVSKDRICLLHRERQLRDGTLEENGLLDGSRIILLPSVETGLLSQRPENSVMQALESLNDSQVNDFLSGKSPLNLTMRLGDHMMLIQLQLSTLNSISSSSSRSIKTSNSSKNSSTSKKDNKETPSSQSTQVECSQFEDPVASCSELKHESLNQNLFKDQHIGVLQNTLNLYQALAEETLAKKIEATDKIEAMDTTHSTDSSDAQSRNSQSPIKSLSNLVGTSISTSNKEQIDSSNSNSPIKNDLMEILTSTKLCNEMPSTSAMSEKTFPSTPSLTPDSSLDSDNFTDQSSFLAESPIDEYPMENLFNSVVDKGLFKDQGDTMMDREISNLATTSNGTQEATSTPLPSFQSLNEPLKNKRFQYLLHKTSKFKHPISQSKPKAFMQSVVNKHRKRMQIRQDSNLAQPSTSRTEPYITNSRKLILQPSSEQPEDIVTPTTSKVVSLTAPESPKKMQRVSPTPPVDTKALIEASKNLTQKLKKLSKEVLTNKIELRTAEETVRSKIGPGAVIESMKHHGKGIYSGTFSGTLNPALQDRHGRPKRDISTIIHILNDLLCAAPPITLGQKESKHLYTASNVEETSKCLGCSQPSCSTGQCDGRMPSTSFSSKQDSSSDQKDCHCIHINPPACPTCRTEGLKSRPAEMCKTCDSAKTLALDNSKTKCKLEQLRLVMQQKKQRREARKLKTLPYTSSPPKTLPSPEPGPAIKEEIETVA